ncbi:hypothetical protein C1D41_004073 [Salmonella enterica subsp. enterica serovar Nottingham]|nr:hypothetical protein [Salmonella enterica subsp. enterica serovar Nottingham]ECB1786292.1 hypothetical protein [Salmonella enterica subsp. enterica serovar Nottingham]EDX6896604.1 hypothetical protein [Salmonella enterica subsp. enterica serovar Nottingham]
MVAVDALVENVPVSIPQTRRAHGEKSQFSYPLDIRKAIYTTNVIESLNSMLRTVIKTQSVSNG